MAEHFANQATLQMPPVADSNRLNMKTTDQLTTDRFDQTAHSVQPAAKRGRPAFERWGRYVLVTAAELDRAEHFFARYGAITVFIGRLLPVVRTFIAFPAGLARMPMAKFQIYTFLGSWPWCFGLAYIGMVLGARWESDPTFRSLFHRFDAVIVALLVAGLVWFVWTRWRGRAGTDNKKS